MIKPTVGRIVWYNPSEWDRTQMTLDGQQPLAAIVAFPVNDRAVNLTVFDHAGATHQRVAVPLLQEGDPRPVYGPFAEWMPFQKGQAAKTEAAEAQLKKDPS